MPAPEASMAQTPEQRRKNLRLGLILFSVTLAFGIGFFVKAMWVGL